MCWQYDWAGSQLINKRILVYPDMLDEPQRQLGTIVLPPDPMPIMNARPENYLIDEQPVSTRYTIDGRIRGVTFARGQSAAWVAERIVAVPGNL